MKPIAGLILAAFFLLAGCGGGEKVTIRVNGEALPVAGLINYDRVYADIIPLGEAMGLKVVFWPDHPDRGVWLQDVEKQLFVHLHTGQSDCHVGGETVKLDAPTLYIDDEQRPMAPVRFVAEAMGATVEETAGKDGGPRTVAITRDYQGAE